MDEAAYQEIRPNMVLDDFVQCLMRAVREDCPHYRRCCRKLTAALGRHYMVDLLEEVHFKVVGLGRQGNTAGGLLLKLVCQDQGKTWWRSVFPRSH